MSEHVGEGFNSPMKSGNRDALVIAMEQGGKVEFGRKLERIESVAVGSESRVVAAIGETRDDGRNDTSFRIGTMHGLLDMPKQLCIRRETDGRGFVQDFERKIPADFWS